MRAFLTFTTILTFLLCFGAASPPYVGGSGHALRFSSARVHEDEYRSFKNLHQHEVSVAVWYRSPCVNGDPFASLVSFTVEVWYKMIPAYKMSDKSKACCWPLLVIPDMLTYEVYNRFNTQTSFFLLPPGGKCADYQQTVFSHPDTQVDEWTHSAVTFSDNAVTLLINGFPVSNDLVCGGKSLSSLAVKEMWIGSNHLGNFEGVMDEMRFWKRARTVDEVRSAMHRSIYRSDYSQLLFYYPMDCYLSDDGPMLKDASGHGYDIVLGADSVRGISNNKRHMPTFTPSTVPFSGQSLALSEVVSGLHTSATTLTRLITPTEQGQEAAAPIFARLYDLTGGKDVLVELVGEQSTSTMSIMSGAKFSAYANISISLPAGVTSAKVDFTLSPSNYTYSGQLVSVLVEKQLNHEPITGGAGGMLYCDGTDDFLYEKEFMIRGEQYGDKIGLGPGTVEFWAYAAKPGHLGTVLSVGNNDVVGSWCQEDYPTNPWYCQGRLLVHVGSLKDQIDINVGPQLEPWNGLGYDMAYWYNSWIHVAITWDGLSQPYGYSTNKLSLYLNGEMVKDTHGYWTNGTLQGLYLCHFPFWGPYLHYYRGYLDEFRIWDHKRNTTELRENMFRTLRGDEPGLTAYYSFDDYQEDYAGDYTMDTATGNRGVFAGCTPAHYPYCRHWDGSMPQVDDCDAEGRRPNVPCYGQGIRNEASKPVLWPSTAPVGGIVPPIIVANNSLQLFKLQGFDYDLQDGVFIKVLSAPARGSLGVVLGSDTQQILPLPERVVAGTTMVFVPGDKAGGRPYAVFSYVAIDEWGRQGRPMEVQVHSSCFPGEHVQGYECTPCPAGTYQPAHSYDPFCLPCPAQTYQPAPGQTVCLSVPLGSFQDSVGTTFFKSCESAGYPPPCIKPYGMSRTLRSLVIITAGIGIFIALNLMAAVLVMRKQTVFSTASVPFLFIILLGIALMCVSTILMSLPQTDGLCMAKYYVGSAGLTLAFGSLLLKMYRLKAIFFSRALSVVRVSEKHLIPLLLGVMLAECVLLAVWHALSPIRINNTLERRCIIDDSYSAFYWIIVVAKSLMVLASVQLLYATRDIPSAFNETRYIAMVLYNVIFLGALVGLVVYGLKDSVTGSAQVSVQCIAQLYIALATMGMLFVPKVWSLMHGRETGFSEAPSIMQSRKSDAHRTGVMASQLESVDGTFQGTGQDTSGGSDTDWRMEDIEQLEKQEELLQKQLGTLRKRIINARRSKFVRGMCEEYGSQDSGPEGRTTATVVPASAATSSNVLRVIPSSSGNTSTATFSPSD